jgi:two-component system, NarL family, response regulator LiaR
MIKVLVVDDHPLVRSGLSALFEVYEDIKVIAEAANGKEAIELSIKYNPDIVLMDLIMPDITGIEATAEINKKCPGIKIIILTSYVDKKLLENSLKAGAVGYVLKNITGDNLIAAIRDTYNGGTILSSEASNILISNIKKPGEIVYNLTPQEKNILTHLVKGLSNKMIAREESLSLSTIKFHVSNILSKLGASCRAEAVSIALKNELIS